MRALVIALLAMMHLAGVAWSGESVVSGDSDHDYLPSNLQREVLLHEFKLYIALISTPATYTTWSTSIANCFQQYNAQA